MDEINHLLTAHLSIPDLISLMAFRGVSSLIGLKTCLAFIPTRKCVVEEPLAVLERAADMGEQVSRTLRSNKESARFMILCFAFVMNHTFFNLRLYQLYRHSCLV